MGSDPIADKPPASRMEMDDRAFNLTPVLVN